MVNRLIPMRPMTKPQGGLPTANAGRRGPHFRRDIITK